MLLLWGIHPKRRLYIITPTALISQKVYFIALTKHLLSGALLSLHHPDIDIKATSPEFIVDNVLHEVVFLNLAKTYCTISKSDIAK